MMTFSNPRRREREGAQGLHGADRGSEISRLKTMTENKEKTRGCKTCFYFLFTLHISALTLTESFFFCFTQPRQ